MKREYATYKNSTLVSSLISTVFIMSIKTFRTFSFIHSLNVCPIPPLNYKELPALFHPILSLSDGSANERCSQVINWVSLVVITKGISLVTTISGWFSGGCSRLEQLQQRLLLPLFFELWSLANKFSREGHAEKSTDFPILLNRWEATDSITCRISGYSSTTSLKSSACKM